MTNEINESCSDIKQNYTFHFIIFHTRKQPTDRQQQHTVRSGKKRKNKRNPTNGIIVQYILPINPIQYPRIYTLKKYPLTRSLFSFTRRIETILLTGHRYIFPSFSVSTAQRHQFSSQSKDVSENFLSHFFACLEERERERNKTPKPRKKESSVIDLIKLLSFFFFYGFFYPASRKEVNFFKVFLSV